jgi:hypothetical protein
MNSPTKTVSLYALGAEWQALEAALVESGGEVTETVEAAFATLGEMEASKCDAYCSLIRSFDGYAELFKAEEQAMAAKRRVAENSARRLKERLHAYLETRGLEKLKGTVWTAALRKNPLSVHLLVPPERLPEQYQRITIEPDKRKLEADLKAPEGHPEVIDYAEFGPPTYHVRVL